MRVETAQQGLIMSAMKEELAMLRASAATRPDGEVVSLRISNELLRDEREALIARSEALRTRAAAAEAAVAAAQQGGNVAVTLAAQRQQQQSLERIEAAERRAAAAVVERDAALDRDAERATALEALAEQLQQQRLRAKNAESDKVLLYTQHKAQLAAIEAASHAPRYEARLATLVAENAALRAHLAPALALAGVARESTGLIGECQRMLAALERRAPVAAPAAAVPATAASPCAQCMTLEGALAALEVERTLERATRAVEVDAMSDEHLRAATMARDEAVERCASLSAIDSRRDAELAVTVDFHRTEIDVVRSEAAALEAALEVQHSVVDAIRAACVATCAAERAEGVARCAQDAAASVARHRRSGSAHAAAASERQAEAVELAACYARSKAKCAERKALLVEANARLDALAVEMAALRAREATAAAAAATCRSAAAELERATVRVGAVEREKSLLLGQLNQLCDVLETEVASDARLAATRGAARESFRLKRELDATRSTLSAENTQLKQYILLFKERHDRKVAWLQQQQQQLQQQQ